MNFEDAMTRGLAFRLDLLDRKAGSLRSLRITAPGWPTPQWLTCAFCLLRSTVR